jgi:hypothetical protein
MTFRWNWKLQSPEYRQVVAVGKRLKARAAISALDEA